jgi:hypothetical protein
MAVDMNGKAEVILTRDPVSYPMGYSITGRRFDSIWNSPHLTVQHIEHPYDAGSAAGSDHAPVIADLIMTSTARSNA